MPFVRRHVTRRLKAAKADCDKELQRITNNITTFFEEKLREADDTDREYRDRGHGRDREYDQERQMDTGYFNYQPDFMPQHSDGYYSDGGYEAEIECGQHSRHRVYLHNPFTFITHLTISSIDKQSGDTKRKHQSTGQTAQRVFLFQRCRI
jgi:serine/threonine-protein kinase RIM15